MDFCCNFGWLGDGWENTCCIRTPNTNNTYQYNKQHTAQTQNTEPDGWAVGSCDLRNKTAAVNQNRRKMVGWLAFVVSEDCGCNSRSLQHCLEMTGWLAPTSSNDFGCNCKSPRDGWDMAGWLALALSNGFGCYF